MLIYFDFEGIRMNADVDWPEDATSITVNLTDPRLVREFPPDLLYDLNNGTRVTYYAENPRNRRLVELQKVIAKRLQEITGSM